MFVIPAKAGIHTFDNRSSHVYPDPRFPGDDKRGSSKRQTDTILFIFLGVTQDCPTSLLNGRSGLRSRLFL
jgi:hypothetical protein